VNDVVVEEVVVVVGVGLLIENGEAGELDHASLVRWLDMVCCGCGWGMWVGGCMDVWRLMGCELE
jgi:hypothetical protein